MNIAIFTNNYLPNPYGVTTSIESFRKEFERRGHAVYIFAPQSEGYKDKNKNVFRYPSLDINYKINFPIPIPYSKKINKKIDELKIDVIHSQHPNLLGWVAMVWAKKKNIPLVFTWHTVYDKYTHYTPIIPKEISNRWVVKNAVKYANRVDQIIIPTQGVEKIIRAWGVKNDNIKAIPTGVEDELLTGGSGEKIRESLKIEKNKKIIMSISRLTEEKNVIFLTKEILKVLKNDSRAVFVLGGDGYLKNELITLVNKAKLGKRVFFVGLIEKSEIKDYLALADIFVYASQSETQGTIISEAMFMKKAIVALKALGISDLIEDGKSGLLASVNRNDFSKKILELLKNEELIKSLGKNAQIEARKKYTSKVCADKMLKIYEELIDGIKN